MQDTRVRLVQHVCKWSPAQLPDIATELAADRPSPATRFPAYDAYLTYFEPLLFAELAAELAAAVSKRRSSLESARRVSVSRVQRESTGFGVDIVPYQSRGPSLSLVDGDILALWDESIPFFQNPSSDECLVPKSAVMAVVRHSLARQGGARIFLSVWPRDQISRDETSFDELEEGEHDELQEDEAEKAHIWKFIPLSSIVTTRREYDAVLNTKNSPLLSAILSTNTESTTYSPLAASQAGQPNPRMQTLTYTSVITTARRLNQSQSRAVAVAATSRDGFTIVQGPPGTGKTRTILAMLNVLHVDQYQCYYDDLLAIFERRSGARLDVRNSAPTGPSSTKNRPESTTLGNMAQALDRTLTSMLDDHGNRSTKLNTQWSRETFHGLQARLRRPRLLVCAPSNAAVDELLTRLVTWKFVDGSGDEYAPDIARIGAGDRVSDSAKSLTAEGQAESFLQRVCGSSSTTDSHKSAKDMYLANWQNMCNSLLAQLEHIPKDHTSRARVVALHEQLERLYRDLRRLRIAVGGDVEAPLSRDIRLRKIARTYVEDAQIVFSTLSGAASAILTNPSDGNENGALFDTVIMDEGSQATEPSSLIPLTLGARRCFLVGDPQQLPATVLSSGSAGVAYGQSLLDRLCRSGVNALLLDQQYRMHPAISSFPRRYFYGGRLVDDESVQDENRSKPCHEDELKPRFGPYAFLDVREGRERVSAEEKSICNPYEAQLAVNIYKTLKKKYPSDPVFGPQGKVPGSPLGFGIVTPYKSQLRELRQAFDRAGVPMGDVEIDTVDSYQGREKDFVIFSCVRTAERRRGIGFVRDVRRMNVGLTRARSSLIVLGSATALAEGSTDWSELIEDASARGCLIAVDRIQKALVVDPETSFQSEGIAASSMKEDSESTIDLSRRQPDKEKVRAGDDGALELAKTLSQFISSTTGAEQTSNSDNAGLGHVGNDGIGSHVSNDAHGDLLSDGVISRVAIPDSEMHAAEKTSQKLPTDAFLKQSTGELGESSKGTPVFASHGRSSKPATSADKNLEPSAEQTLRAIDNSLDEKPIVRIRAFLRQVAGVLGSSYFTNMEALESVLLRHVNSGGTLDLETVVAAAIATGSNELMKVNGIQYSKAHDASTSTSVCNGPDRDHSDEDCGSDSERKVQDAEYALSQSKKGAQCQSDTVIKVIGGTSQKNLNTNSSNPQVVESGAVNSTVSAPSGWGMLFEEVKPDLDQEQVISAKEVNIFPSHGPSNKVDSQSSNVMISSNNDDADKYGSSYLEKIAKIEVEDNDMQKCADSSEAKADVELCRISRETLFSRDSLPMATAPEKYVQTESSHKETRKTGEVSSPGIAADMTSRGRSNHDRKAHASRGMDKKRPRPSDDNRTPGKLLKTRDVGFERRRMRGGIGARHSEFKRRGAGRHEAIAHDYDASFLSQDLEHQQIRILQVQAQEQQLNQLQHLQQLQQQQQQQQQQFRQVQLQQELQQQQQPYPGQQLQQQLQYQLQHQRLHDEHVHQRNMQQLLQHEQEVQQQQLQYQQLETQQTPLEAHHLYGPQYRPDQLHQPRVPPGLVHMQESGRTYAQQPILQSLFPQQEINPSAMIQSLQPYDGGYQPQYPTMVQEMDVNMATQGYGPSSSFGPGPMTDLLPGPRSTNREKQNPHFRGRGKRNSRRGRGTRGR